MKDKRLRQTEILDLIAGQPVRTQQELAELLRKRGIRATQSTLSKDIKDLGLIKVPVGGNGVRYCAPVHGSIPHTEAVIRRELMDFVIDFETAGNLLVIKTTAGNASGVCAAIDGINWPEAVGTVAGDDTIFVACKAAEHARVLQGRMNDIVRGHKA